MDRYFQDDTGGCGYSRGKPPPPTIRSPATRLDTRKIIHVPFIEEFYYTVIYLYENSCTSKVIRRRGKNSLRGRNEVTPGDGYRDRVESNRIESNRHWRSSRGVVVVQRNFFSSPPPPPCRGSTIRLIVKRRIATLRSLCYRGAVIDSSLPARNARSASERVYTHTIARQTRSHAQDSRIPVEMKLGRGVEIPPLPLLNWNLIARPRRSITRPRVYSPRRCKS